MQRHVESHTRRFGGRRRHQQMNLLLVGSEDVFTEAVTERIVPAGHFRVIARSSSLLEAEIYLESRTIDMVLLSPEYREAELSLFTVDARHRGFAGPILLAADTPGEVSGNIPRGNEPMQVGDFYIHAESRRVWVRGDEVQFRPLEFELLQFLCKRPDQLLHFKILLEFVWGDPDASRHALRVLIGAVRAKIETTQNPRYIITERPFGYRFIPSPAPLSRDGPPGLPSGIQQ